MSKPVIVVENVSKMYRLGSIGTGAFGHDLNRFWHKIRGKEDPYLKIGVTNDRTTQDDSEYVWALRDINFEVTQGEVLGIIGRNGAGKSTLLKLLSRTTTPTTGSIKAKGRIASLLEVGTGFHPDLTGRDNIYLNGAILGMSKAEIKTKFDEIVAFSGVERYIDTPVKRYSSGMYVRLAFGVAAHLESEILIIDEVLAVGDAEFQKKAIGKMQDVATGQGRTVLFVSHNMAAVRRLCTSSILMRNGTVESIGSIEKITDLYLKYSDAGASRVFTPKDSGKYPLTIESVSVVIDGKNENQIIDLNDRIKIRVEYQVNVDDLRGSNIMFGLSKENIVLFKSWDVDMAEYLLNGREKGTYVAEFFLPDYLGIGRYSIMIGSGKAGVGAYKNYEDCLVFDIDNVTDDGSSKSFTRGGMLKTTLEWNLEKRK